MKQRMDWNKLTKESLIEAIKKSIQSKDMSQQAVGVMKRSTENVLERIRQNFDAQVKEDSYPVIEQFVATVASKLSAMSQQWVDCDSNDLIVFPEGTRYIFRDGAYTTVVIEQQPQNRHINIQGLIGSGRMYMLALPYVQFIIPFLNHSPLRRLYVGMTKKPITDLDQMIFNPVVPNVNDHFVCTGDTSWPESGTITEKVDKIIGGFWQSQFTDDASGFMNNFMKDNNLTLEQWQNKSKEDPTFIVNRLTKFRAGATIRRFLAIDQGGKKINLVNNLKTEIINAVGIIGGDLQKLITNIDVKTENRDKAHIEVLGEILKEILVQAHAELWESMQIQLQNQLQNELQNELQKFCF